MTEHEIKQAVEDYFNEMLAKDADYLDNVTDSWIYDAEDWFLKRLEDKGIKIFDSDYEFTKGTEELVDIFEEIARKRFDELCDEKYAKRDALFELDRIMCDIKQINKTFIRIKHHFNKFNAYTDAVTYQFEELEKGIKLLDDIENDKVESLKEKGE